MGCGGDLVVSVLVFFSDDPSSNPAEVYNFSVKRCLKKEAGLDKLKKFIPVNRTIPIWTLTNWSR